MTSSPDIGACAYIGGRWAQTPAARTFRTALPHDTRQSGREFGCATPADAEAAVARATAAAAPGPPCRRCNAPSRCARPPRCCSNASTN
ncbi:hypothetical protein [Bordetella bronchiseptica]|uniref:hypothetical protein n=1 Tax=Bordetella bronchiseptica TaxID=518 RepID=UPI001F16490F|nr:hypothetical protein [Bordetella bronchiseptica]